MRKNYRNELLLLPKRYPCLDSFIIVLFYTAINAVVVLGIMMCIQSLAIAFHALVDINILLSFLKTDYIVLFWASVLTITSASLGLMSGFQHSKSGLLTSMGLFIITFFIIDGYAIGFRVKDYLSKTQLSNILYDALRRNLFENFQFHFMQRELSCCGVHHHTDWIAYHNVIPGSCCNNMTICKEDDPAIYKNSCLNAISEILRVTYQATVDIIIILNVCLVLALFAGYFYWYLLRQMKKIRKIPLSRINMPTLSANQPSRHAYMIDTNTILSGHNTHQNFNYDYYNAYETNENNDPTQQTRHVTIQENNNTVQEETNTAQEEANTAQEEANTAQEEANTPQEEADTPQEEDNTPQEEDNTVLNNNSAVNDSVQPVNENNPTTVNILISSPIS